MRRRSFYAFALLAYAPFCGAQSADPPILAVEAASYHVPVLSNDYVKVLNVRIPPRRDSGYHRHSLDSVAVLMSDATRTNTTLGAEPVARPAQPRGTVAFSPYARDPLVHTVTLQGDQTFHNIVVELLQPSAGRTPSDRPPIYTPVLDNERVRVWRLVLEPGEAAPPSRKTHRACASWSKAASSSRAWWDNPTARWRCATRTFTGRKREPLAPCATRAPPASSSWKSRSNNP